MISQKTAAPKKPSEYRALVFGTQLIFTGDRVDVLFKAVAKEPILESCEDGTGLRYERLSYSDSGTTTIFTVRARRIVSIEQHIGDAAIA